MATGSSATVGTGAFTTSSADRRANLNVAADTNDFVEITALNPPKRLVGASVEASPTGDSTYTRSKVVVVKSVGTV